MAPSCSLQVATENFFSYRKRSLTLPGQVKLLLSSSKESQRRSLYFYSCLSGSTDSGCPHNLYQKRTYWPWTMPCVPKDADTHVPLVSGQETNVPLYSLSAPHLALPISVLWNFHIRCHSLKISEQVMEGRSELSRQPITITPPQNRFELRCSKHISGFQVYHFPGLNLGFSFSLWPVVMPPTHPHTHIHHALSHVVIELSHVRISGSSQ